MLPSLSVFQVGAFQEASTTILYAFLSQLSELHVSNGNLLYVSALRILCGLFEWRIFPRNKVQILYRVLWF